MNNPNFDMYYDNPSNRSPTSQRQNSLHRQASRQQFEAYGHLPSGLYTAEDHAQFNGNRYNDMRNATVGGYGNGYDMGAQSWNTGAFGQNNTLNGLGGSGLRKPPSRAGRSGLPSAWLDQNQQMQMNPFMAGLGGMSGQQVGRQDMSEPDEELIPTAIVIKNIPFAIKKEQLVGIMTEMGLPLPYAFNYHFDNGVFRGLAFANFTNPEETATVIDAMNHFELNGRKLRVEYKKMLPAAERERIEREKRERRGQLEEQHRPMAPQALQTQASASSLSSRVLAGSPSPVTARNQKMGVGFPASFPDPGAGVDVDLNDPQALQYYSKLLLFKEDTARDMLIFSPTLSPPERRIVHTLAHHMGLGHMSKGEADRRAVHVYKEGRQRLSPPMPSLPNLHNGDQRRALNRAATTDFSDVRANENYYGGPLRHQASGYLGGYHDSPGGLAAGNNLRSAKSFADLRSYTPSPVPSTASFPAALSHNVARLQEFGRDSAQSNTPTLMTPISSTADRGDANNIINGLGNMNLGPGFGGSPRGVRGISSWDRENPGPIGSNRSFSTNYDDRSSSRSALQGGPERQPRGPLPERGSGFPRRQNGHVQRNSDEISQQSSAAEITVEH
ncbi:RNA-binding PIN4 [Lecanosticta acicola]|uniref:RNA-binding PIN4 n=1 Tax=Lecanosticta acicola TaxID=111012 RepID=A0AAI8YSY9_9PEZI|nr:RNA-binding PIN4 [Lecanosticta acicola]